jgi:hypothetical protein
VAKKQVLGLKPASRLEQVGNEHSESAKDRKHKINDATILSYDVNLGRMEFSERTGVELHANTFQATKGQVIGRLIADGFAGSEAERLMMEDAMGRRREYCIPSSLM